MYSRAGAAVGCVRAAVPPRPAVAAYSGYRRGRRLRAGRSAATVDGGCRHLPTRSPTPCQRLTSRSYLGRIDHWHARLASGPLQLVPLGATTPRGHSNSYPSEPLKLVPLGGGPTPTRTPRGPLQLVPLGAHSNSYTSGPPQLVPLGAHSNSYPSGPTPTRTPRGHSNSYPSGPTPTRTPRGHSNSYPSGPTDLVSLRVCPVVSSNT
jgi:hypothetical protein